MISSVKSTRIGRANIEGDDTHTPSTNCYLNVLNPSLMWYGQRQAHYMPGGYMGMVHPCYIPIPNIYQPYNQWYGPPPAAVQQQSHFIQPTRGPVPLIPTRRVTGLDKKHPDVVGPSEVIMKEGHIISTKKPAAVFQDREQKNINIINTNDTESFDKDFASLVDDVGGQVDTERPVGSPVNLVKSQSGSPHLTETSSILKITDPSLKEVTPVKHSTVVKNNDPEVTTEPLKIRTKSNDFEYNKRMVIEKVWKSPQRKTKGAASGRTAILIGLDEVISMSEKSESDFSKQRGRGGGIKRKFGGEKDNFRPSKKARVIHTSQSSGPSELPGHLTEHGAFHDWATSGFRNNTSKTNKLQKAIPRKNPNSTRAVKIGDDETFGLPTPQKSYNISKTSQQSLDSQRPCQSHKNNDYRRQLLPKKDLSKNYRPHNQKPYSRQQKPRDKIDRESRIAHQIPYSVHLERNFEGYFTPKLEIQPVDKENNTRPLTTSEYNDEWDRCFDELFTGENLWRRMLKPFLTDKRLISPFDEFQT